MLCMGIAQTDAPFSIKRGLHVRPTAPPRSPRPARRPPPLPLGLAAWDALYVSLRLWLRRTRSASCSAPVAGLTGR